MPETLPEEKLIKLRELIHLFQVNITQYKKSSYDEANTRVDFIDKFFELLEWDVRNVQGYSEAYREVVREDKVIIAGKPKAPDYSFRIGGRKFFFVEAKKPCVNIKEDRDPAFQLRRYGYTAKLALSILTDFEELAVYDTRIKPVKTDKASTARIFYCEFIDLIKQNSINPDITNFEYIYSIFSKQAILKGSFDRYIEETKNKKGTSDVDKEILKLIDGWRCDLARNIALRNTDLDVYNLNYAVQKIIDRIIFLRIAEDRNTEEYGKLKSILNEKDVYTHLVQVFDRANAKYNSGLFAPQSYLAELQIDNKVLSAIINSFYYPECPYELSILPIEILGNAYEQFLGKKIRLTASHQAKIEEKPEVRKAGGVYYTPQYIVDYIVQNTIGEKVKRKKPEDIEHLTIVDPACGSGSFLVRAYDFLLKHHIKYYCQKSKKETALKKGKIYQVDETTYYLSIDEKQRILLNNIYGVDIDEQAVEVTKLSLLLKLMENEGVEYTDYLFKHHDLTLLPDLSNNIKCGNSLIGSDFYDDKDLGLFDKEEMRKVNVFDWDKEFPAVFENGGFDCVVGNPPYIRIQIMKEITPHNIDYLKSTYPATEKGNTDIYITFIEKGLLIINDNGILGLIIPNKFMTTDYGKGIRKIICENNYLEKLIDFGYEQVFENATIYTCLLFLNNNNNDQNIYYKKLYPSEYNLNLDFSYAIYPKDYISDNIWVFRDKKETQILEKLLFNTITLLDLPTYISRGSSSGNDKIFMLKILGNNYYKDLNSNTVKLENEILKIPVFATDFSRYIFNPTSNKVIIFPYKIINNRAELLTQNELKNKYPNTWTYLNKNKRELLKRKQFKEWYGFSAPRNLILHSKADIIIPLLANRGLFTVLPKNQHEYCLMASGGFSITVNNLSISKEYLLALINSKLLFWYLKSISNDFRSGWITCTKQYMGKLPIVNNPKEDLKLKIENNVKEILKIQVEALELKSINDQKIYKQKIDLLDKQIDNLVYKLYDLTGEEIKIVEES